VKPASALLLALAFTALVTTAVARPAPLAPPEYRRGEDQTFLTFPEWYLVYSPAEYAVLLRDRGPSAFPWWGHIGQLWSSYGAVINATRAYPFNAGYHVMICVIGVSTTVEYALRSAYETLIGRVAELAAPAGGTAEDRYAAKVAQEYVDFIRVEPWYQFDFIAALRGLWRNTPATGPGLLRKWERRYALTTEYGIKAAYGWLLGLGTQSAYGVEPLVTAVVLDAAPPAPPPQVKPLRVQDDGRWLGTLPRYDAFKDQARALAAGGREFREIAGNGPQAPVLVSVIAPQGWRPGLQVPVLFAQPIITQPGRTRLALVVRVSELAGLLRMLESAPVELEHVYDY
jgi:hypothetical protein